MSEQSDSLNALARARGILPASPPEQLEYVRAPRDGEQLIAFASNAAAIVAKNGLFRRCRTPVTIDPETGRIEDMQADRLRTYVERHLVPYVRRRGNYEGESMKVPVTITNSEARGCLASDAFCSPLRKLRRVNFVRLPVMRRSGRIELLPKGYDAESETLTMKDCFDYPTDCSLDAAVNFLRKFFSEFPFVNPRSLAVQVCGMQAVYSADLLPIGAKRLSFAYRSNLPRAGKGLLLQSAIAPTCGLVQIQAIPDSKDEFRKILDTEALNASRYIVLDECGRRLSDRTLNAFITASTWTGRLMNTQRKFAVSQESIVFVAGNNLQLSADLAGRFLLCDLRVEEADAQQRQIKHVIDECYLARQEVRSDFLAASWALVRAWDEAGRPGPASVFRGFETFSNVIGGIVTHAGFGNPLRSTALETDRELAEVFDLVEELARGIADRKREYRFHEIIQICRRINAFESHTEPCGATGIAGLSPADKSWFGKLFSERFNACLFTLADGRRVRFESHGRNRGRRYTVEIVSSDDSVRPCSEETMWSGLKRPMKRRKP